MTDRTTLPGLAPSDAMYDAVERVTGRTRYAVDVTVPGMAHVALVRSPVPAGRILGVDTAAATRAAGVVRIVTGADVAAAGLGAVRFGTMEKDQPILAADHVTFTGEPIAAVVAETAAEARAAADLVVARIERTPAVFDPDAALSDGAPLVHPARRPDNVLGRWQLAHGDLPAARASASWHFRHEFSSPAAQHVSLEPHVCVARWEDGRLETWTTSQNPSRVAEELARIFSLEPGQLRLHVPSLGGAYGGKNHAKHEPLTALVARLTGRPVRLVNRREDEFVTVTKHPARILVESGVDRDGRFAYRAARLRWSGGAYALSSLAVMRAGGIAVLGPYRIPAAEVESVVAYTNLPPAGSFRGLGVNQAAWAGEQQLDMIAADLGIDAVELRRRNLVRPGDRLWTGEPAGDAHWLDCLERAVADLASVRPPDAHAAASATGGRQAVGDHRRGRGVAVVMKHTITPSRSDAAVVLRADGQVEVRTSAVDMGQGSPTTLARIAGRVLGIGLDRVHTILPDTAITPYDATSSSSRITFAAGEAVERAAQELLDLLFESASVVLGEPPDRLTREDGATVSADGRRVDDAAAVATAGVPELVGTASFVNQPITDPDTGKPVSSSHWHQGALAVEVAVDPATGVIEVERAHGAAWAGEVVSVPGARLQNEGNVIFGLGQALWERLEFDGDGRPAPVNLLDYRVPSVLDVPGWFTTHALEADPSMHRERHGLGESLIPAVAPAVGNAVAAAVGNRLFDLPLHPERIRAAIVAARGGAGDHAGDPEGRG
jgi:CO/xanthine dehydrogenase Mo-binding subunit